MATKRKIAFKDHIQKSQKAFFRSIELLQAGKKAEAKRAEKEGDAHLKEARKLHKQLKDGTP